MDAWRRGPVHPPKPARIGDNRFPEDTAAPSNFNQLGVLRRSNRPRPEKHAYNGCVPPSDTPESVAGEAGPVPRVLGRKRAPESGGPAEDGFPLGRRVGACLCGTHEWTGDWAFLPLSCVQRASKQQRQAREPTLEKVPSSAQRNRSCRGKRHRNGARHVSPISVFRRHLACPGRNARSTRSGDSSDSNDTGVCAPRERIIVRIGDRHGRNEEGHLGSKRNAPPPRLPARRDRSLAAAHGMPFPPLPTEPEMSRPVCTHARGGRPPVERTAHLHRHRVARRPPPLLQPFRSGLARPR